MVADNKKLYLNSNVGLLGSLCVHRIFCCDNMTFESVSSHVLCLYLLPYELAFVKEFGALSIQRSAIIFVCFSFLNL